jgi:RimJ/RimL family protein N-acetyltransferase
MSEAPILTTERLWLRELREDDEDALTAMFADPDVMRWIGAGRVLTRGHARRVIARERDHYAARGWGEWATVERASGEMAGLCGLILWPAIDDREELEVAYLLPVPRRGRGLATEAAVAIRDFGRSIVGRDDLVSLIYPDNAASIRVAEKVGMAYEKDVDLDGSRLGLYRLGVGAGPG